MSEHYVGIDWAANQLGQAHGEQFRIEGSRSQTAYFTAGLAAARFEQDGREAYLAGFVEKFER